jgi:hypothetical protein
LRRVLTEKPKSKSTKKNSQVTTRSLPRTRRLVIVR